MRIGMGLGLYQQSAGRLPGVRLGEAGPIAAMLDDLGQPDFAAIDGPEKRPPRRLSGPVAEHTIPGLICPSDRDASAARHPAPISYRANTGDTTDGLGGPFAIGRSVAIGEVEAADGASYTAAFAERLVGDGRSGVPGPADYAAVPGPIGPSGCPGVGPSAWRGDAGSSWLKADWRSTLYGHLPAPRSPSCVAEDGRTAFLGASSPHPSGIHVLMLDGSSRTYRPDVAPAVWRALGTVGEAAR